MLKFPIPDHVLFEFKYFSKERSDNLRMKIKSFKFEEKIQKPHKKMKDFFFKERIEIMKQNGNFQTENQPKNIEFNEDPQKIENKEKIAEESAPKTPIEQEKAGSEYAPSERSLLEDQEMSEALKSTDGFKPPLPIVNKHFLNLEYLFRPHLVVPEDQLGDILEIFSFFIYFYDQIDGPDFELEELYLCLKERKYSALSHDIHISLINIYLKEYLNKQQISFEKENGMFFVMLQKVAIRDRQQKALLRIFWPEFLKEILIRRLLDEESIEAEVDELLVEIQGLDLQEGPNEDEDSANDNKIETEGNDQKGKIEEEKENNEKEKIQEEKKDSEPIETDNQKNLEMEKDPVALEILNLYESIKYSNLQTYDQLPIKTKINVLLFLINDMMELSSMRDNLHKKNEEVNQMISDRTKKLTSIKEMEAQIKVVHEKIQVLEKETEAEEKKREETMTELDRKELMVFTQKINSMRGERNKLSRNIGKLENSIMKASKDLRDLNKKIPLGLYSKKDLAVDSFGNRYMIFAFDQIRLFKMDSKLRSARVFTGNFEIVKDFLDKRGREQSKFTEVLEKFVALGILNQSKSVKFSTKIFGSDYFSVFDPVLDANNKLAEIEEEARLKAEKLESERQKDSGVENKQDSEKILEEKAIEKVEEKPDILSAGMTAPIAETSNNLGKPQESKIADTTTQKQNEKQQISNSSQNKNEAAANETPKTMHELLGLEHEFQMRLCGLDSAESLEHFQVNKRLHIQSFLQSMRRYNSMFEIKPSKPTTKTKQSKFHFQLWGSLLTFMLERPLEKRCSLRFFKDLLFFIERHFQEYLSLINSYWIEDDEYNTKFSKRVDNCRTIESLKELLSFVNSSFQVCYSKIKIEPESDHEEKKVLLKTFLNLKIG